MTASLVEIGRIVRRHGIRGEVRLLPHNPDSTVLDSRPEVILERPDGPREGRTVLAVRRHKRFLLVRFEGVDSAAAADALVGCSVHVRAGDLPERSADEVYYYELIGCRVETEEGRELGSVREVFDTGSNAVCAVRGSGEEYLVPLVADVVAELCVEKRRMVIRALPGLLDPGDLREPDGRGRSR